jgi:hypothetical protein
MCEGPRKQREAAYARPRRCLKCGGREHSTGMGPRDALELYDAECGRFVSLLMDPGLAAEERWEWRQRLEDWRDALVLARGGQPSRRAIAAAAAEGRPEDLAGPTARPSPRAVHPRVQEAALASLDARLSLGCRARGEALLRDSDGSYDARCDLELLARGHEDVDVRDVAGALLRNPRTRWGEDLLPPELLPG